MSDLRKVDVWTLRRMFIHDRALLRRHGLARTLETTLIELVPRLEAELVRRGEPVPPPRQRRRSVRDPRIPPATHADQLEAALEASLRARGVLPSLGESAGSKRRMSA